MSNRSLSPYFGVAAILLVILTGCTGEDGNETGTGLAQLQVEGIVNLQQSCPESSSQPSSLFPVDVDRMIVRIFRGEDREDVTDSLCMSENPCTIPLETGRRFFRIPANVNHRFVVELRNRADQVIYFGEKPDTVGRGEVKPIDIRLSRREIVNLVKDRQVEAVSGDEISVSGTDLQMQSQNLHLSILPFELQEDIRLTVETVHNPRNIPQQLILAGVFVRIATESEDPLISSVIDLTFPYDEELLNKAGVEESSLKLFRLDRQAGQWAPLPGQLPDTDTNVIRLTEPLTSLDLFVVGCLPLPDSNRRPVAHGQIVRTFENTPVKITLTGSDANLIDDLMFNPVGEPTVGTIKILDEVSLIYYPLEDFDGSDEFAFEASDGMQSSIAATITVVVEAVTLNVGLRPEAIAVADLNGDANEDLVTANIRSDDVSVLLGAGDGTFAVERRFNVGSDPVAIAVADLNDDRVPDLVTANESSNDVSLLLGAGDGTFVAERPVPIAVGMRPVAIAVADLDKDGTLDLVTANEASSNVSVLFGLGRFLFSHEQVISVGEAPTAIEVVNLNGDMYEDLVIVNRGDDNVSVLLGAEGDTFPTESRSSFNAGTRPVAIEIADLNDDGILDLVTANLNSNDVSVLLGAGGGAFADEQPVDVGAGPESVAVANFNRNRDEIPDLVTANGIDDNVSVLFGAGDGTFEDEDVERRVAVGNTPVAIAVANLDRDGNPYLVVANRNSNDISVFRSDNNGNFEAIPEVRMEMNPAVIAATDLNGDEHIDLVAANLGSNDISVQLGPIDGIFTAESSVDVGTSPIAIAMGNLNGDAHVDLVTANLGSDDVSILFGDGEGAFTVEPSINVGTSPVAIVVADLDDDGDADVIVTANRDSDDVSVVFEVGDGNFIDVTRVNVGMSPAAIAMDDLDKDGNVDLVTANLGSDDVSVLLGVEGENFIPGSRATVGTSPVAIVVAHFDGDEYADLATANRDSGDVSVLLGDGDGTFTPAPRVMVGFRLSAIAVANLNGDEHADLVVAN